MGKKDTRKFENLHRLIELLLDHPEGLIKSEIARRLNVDRSTAGDYIDSLEAMSVPVYEIFPDRFTINRDTYQVRISIDLHEAMALHLATRLLTTRTDKHYPHAASALRTLGRALEKLAPLVSEHIKNSADVLDADDRRRDPIFMQALETLTRAWARRRKVHLTHEMDDGSIHEYTFAPYFIEPYAVGRTMHVIGVREPSNKIRTFKIERIRTIELLENASYDIPISFDPRAHLKNAWGIWFTDREPETVKLHFTRNVAKRVRETVWHHTQEISEQPDGSIIWTAQVAEWQEMLPWIRGWGSEVIILEPDELIEEVKKHLYRSARNYKLVMEQKDPLSRLLRLWGKTTIDAEVFQPALYHMLDVAHIAQQLLSPRATPRWRKVLGDALSTRPDGLNEWLPYLIALHDIGKLSIPFQFLNDSQAARLKNEAFDFGKVDRKTSQALHHTIVGRILLENLSFAANWPDHFRMAFLEMIGGHHGFYSAEEMDDERKFRAINEPAEWQILRQTALQWLESYLCLAWPDPLPNPANVSAAVVALNGFCILCDWLGSDEQYFTPKPHTSLDEYVQHSRKKAFERVRDAGFFQKATSQAPTTFAELFAFPPRPLQAAIDHIPDALLAHPTLTIIEAPTGEGKTEAALTLARRIAALRGFDEMYIALPTTATSNAMYDRITYHLQKRLGLDPHLAQLVHGQSFLKENDLSVAPSANGDGERPPAMDWFAPKKKALLAPFGIGTIDQAELSTLNVKHNALRMIGLAGKVIILDEVHAYDTYMTTIIKRMLAWLSALGSSVILLSATLPIEKRQELAAAFAGDVANRITNQKAYPNLLTIGKEVYTPPEVIDVYQPDKKILVSELQFTDDQAAEKAVWLSGQVKNGGCVCWITNTVDRAQDIFKELQGLKLEDVSLTLLHGRFPQEDRAKLETAILTQYSNGDHAIRPQKGIVIGTQVLEQSLDLDFDVMVTDLAPIDLILQRAGRLHRHSRQPSARYTHTTPHLYLNTYTTNADNGIYGEYLLQMTAKALQAQLANQLPIMLPAHYRPLVEAVYTADKPDKDNWLYGAWKKMDDKANDLEQNANLRLANRPYSDDFIASNKIQFQEDEDSSAWKVAQTRWGQESLTIIPLMRVGETVVPVLSPDLTPIPLDQPADRVTQLRLRQRSIRISNYELVKVLKEQQAQEMHKLFTHSSLLKACVPLWLEPKTSNPHVFANDNLPKPVYLHPVTGLVFGKFKTI